VSDKHIYFLGSEHHLLLAFKLCESPEKVLANNCSDIFLHLIVDYFMTSKTDVIVSREKNNDNGELNTKQIYVRQNIFNCCMEQKCLLYNRSVGKHECKLDNYYLKETIVEDRNVNIAVYGINEVNSHGNTNVQFLKQWPVGV